MFGAFAALGAGLWLAVWWRLPETRRAMAPGARHPPLAALIRERRFWGFALCAACSVGAFFAFLAGGALVAARAFALGPLGLGMALGSITAGFALGSYLSTRLARRWRLGRMLVIARMVPCVGLTIGLVVAAGGFGTLWSFLSATLCVGLANGLSLPVTTTGALSVRPDLAGAASGLSGALTMAIGALATWGIGALVAVMPSPQVLLAAMLALCLLSLGAALSVRDA